MFHSLEPFAGVAEVVYSGSKANHVVRQAQVERNAALPPFVVDPSAALRTGLSNLRCLDPLPIDRLG